MKPLAVLVSLITATFASAQFTAGNLAVLRVGDGSAALTNASTLIFIDQFSISGGSINSTAIPGTGADRLTNSGSATSGGPLTRSTNGLFLNFAGYDTDPGLVSVTGSTATAVPRVVGQVNGAATYTRLGNFGTTGYSGDNIRGAVMDGTNVWGSGNASAGGNGGTRHLGSGVQVSTTPNNTRVVNIFNGQLYMGSASGAHVGISSVGTGLPTNSGNTSTVVIATGAGSSPYAFQANTLGDVVYVADDRANASGGIQKWTWNGSAWALAYTLGTGATNIGARGLTVDWSNPNAPILYATTAEGTANRLISIVDTGAASTATTLATAATNTIFRGVDQTLLPATWTNTASGNWVASNTSTTGFSNAFSNWSVGLSNGVNVAFQKVNAANVTASNNSGLNGISSISFTGAGFGSQNTQYTLTGSGIFLTGTTATGFGVTNNSGVTQTIDINLSVAGPQTFNAASGDLTFGGSVSLFTNALTVTGASNTTISGVVSGGFGGSLTKSGTGTLTLSNTNTYDGGTTINGGTLVASATNATGTGTTTVNNGGTLRGSANLSAIVVNNGGTVAPGTSPGTLNSGLATWNGGGIYEFEINDATGTAGANWDLWNVTDNNGLTINATAGNQFVVNIPDPQTVANFNPTLGYSWQFASFVGSIGGAGFDPAAFNVVFGGPFAGNGTFTVSSVGGGLFLDFSPVPEPSSMLLVGAIAGTFFLRRRMKRSI